MTEDQLTTALQAEYLHIQKTIEDFDSRALTIKAWSVTFGLVAIAGAFASHSSIPFLISAASALIFYMLEIQWKIFQISYYDRSKQIEAHFRGEARVEHPFQINTAWYSTWSVIRYSDIPRVARWPHVFLPHVVVMALGALLFIMSAIHIINL